MKRRLGLLGLSAAAVVAAAETAIALGCGGDLGGGSTQNGCDWWAPDCDGISSAVKVEPANSRYGFTVGVHNSNPSLAVGTSGNGYLVGGLNLPDFDDGFYEYRPNPQGNPQFDPLYDVPDGNDWGILRLINVIESAGRDWANYDPNMDSCYYWRDIYRHSVYLPEQFGVGDMSKDGGGQWLHSYNPDPFNPRHRGHQNGTEADIRYLRKSNYNSSLNISTNPWDYDTVATADLITCIIHAANALGGLEVMIVDSADLGFFDPRYMYNDTTAIHQSHFHIRVHTPR